MNDPELNAMEKIHEAMTPLSAADQRKVARWSLPTTDIEVTAQIAVVGALAGLKEPQRVRVSKWAFDPKVGRFTGPATAKPGRPKTKDRTIDLRVPGAAA